MDNDLDLLKEKLKAIPLKNVFEKLGIVQGRGNVYHCFLHEDKTPSLTIHPGTNTFYCYGCKIGSDIINLYAEYYKLDISADYKKIIKLACKDFDIRKSTGEAALHKREIQKKKIIIPNCLSKYELELYTERIGICHEDSQLSLEQAHTIAIEQVKQERLSRNKIIFKTFYEYCTSSGIAPDVMQYLYSRGLTDNTIQKFQVFSLPNQYEVCKYLLSKFDLSDLQRAGMFNTKGNFIFSNSHRIIIPYLENTEIVYLRCRFFNQYSNPNTPRLKYFGLCNDELNLNTSKRFYNSDILKSIQPDNEIFLLEGEFDCMLSNQIEMSAVGIGGAGNIPTDLTNLLPYDITVIPDSDTAGTGAFKELQRQFAKHYKNISMLSLPDNCKDLTEYFLKHNKQINTLEN